MMFVSVPSIKKSNKSELAFEEGGILEGEAAEIEEEGKKQTQRREKKLLFSPYIKSSV